MHRHHEAQIVSKLAGIIGQNAQTSTTSGEVSSHTGKKLSDKGCFETLCFHFAETGFVQTNLFVHQEMPYQMSVR